MSDIKQLDFKEFVEGGFLQEANRQFFHPLGIAVSVEFNEDNEPVGFGGIWDYRDDPEGLYYDQSWMDDSSVREEFKAKAEKIQDLRESKEEERQRILGFVVQPVTDCEPVNGA